MSIPTLAELRRMADELASLEAKAKAANERVESLRKCGGYQRIDIWLSSRISFMRDRDYDGLTKVLQDALSEFGPAILEALARRQELAAHEAMTAAVMKRAELGTFVTLETAVRSPA